MNVSSLASGAISAMGGIFRDTPPPPYVPDIIEYYCQEVFCSPCNPECREYTHHAQRQAADITTVFV